jgi:L-seryl-tRNA(Ser) seleniumtransferase
MVPDKNELLRNLPSVDVLTESISNLPEAVGFSRKYVTAVCRDELEIVRKMVLDGKLNVDDLQDVITNRIKTALVDLKTPALKRVVNLTGVFVHTNLGRSPLPQQAIDALITAGDYCNLEYDLSERRRGKRDRNLFRMLNLITGCEHFLLVNNNAAGLFLMLNTFAKGKQVAVSRGELIEIGGSFRIPDIMRSAGAKLVEVGTTNRTRISDYEKAAHDGAMMFLKVHTSNYKIGGFTESVKTGELVDLAKKRGVLCIEDLGSGSFVNLEELGIPYEPTVQDSLNEGVDLVSFSVDKLLGGPQGGLVLGKRDLIDQMNKNPIKRVVRAGKLTLLALEATLRMYLDQDNFLRKHPLYRNFFVDNETLQKRGFQLIEKLTKQLGDNASYQIRPDKCYLGGGSLPEQAIDTIVLEITPLKIKLKKLADLFFENDPPIIGRTSNDCLIFDLRQLENVDDAVPSGSL